MLYDIIVILIILISIFAGYKIGAAKTILTFIGSVCCFLIAVFLGDYLSTLTYDNFVSESILSTVTQSLNANGGVIMTEDMPALVRFALNFAGEDVKALIDNAVSSAPTLIAQSVETALKPIILSLLSFIFTAIIFVVVYFLFRVLVLKLLLNIFRLPLIKGVNSILGAVFGLINSVLFISFIAFLLKLIMPYLQNVPYAFSESIIYNSYIFYHFYSGNIFNTIISLF